MLPPIDAEYIGKRSPAHRVSAEGGMVCVILPDFPLPPGLNVDRADLLLRLPAGYPDAAPDMWWFNPAVTRSDGSQIAATQAREHHLGRDWQRWSRHLQPGQWRSGIDSIESYLALVSKELLSAALRAA
jgi:hypothetical protein